MALVSRKETWITGRDASLNAKVQRTYRRTWVAITDDPKDGPLVVTDNSVITAAIQAIPALYTPYTGRVAGEADWGAFVVAIRPRQDPEFAQRWEIDVDYATQLDNPEGLGGGTGSGGHAGGGDPTQLIENPLDRPAAIRWDRIAHRRVVQGPVNSAGQPFDPPLEKDIPSLSLIVERNFLGFDPLTAISYMGTVNSAPFLGAEPGRVFCHSITADRQFERGFFFWRVRGEFHFNEEGWDAIILDAGYYQLVADPIEPAAMFLAPIYDKRNATVVAGPVPLNGRGQELAFGDPPFFHTFVIHRYADHNAIGFF